MGIGFRIGIILEKEQSVKIQHPESGNAEVINIVVCMKIVIDPEAPFSVFRIDRENKNLFRLRE